MAARPIIGGAAGEVKNPALTPFEAARASTWLGDDPRVDRRAGRGPIERQSCLGPRDILVVPGERRRMKLYDVSVRLSERMPDDMDYDAGSLLQDKSDQAATEELLKLVLAVASGMRTCSEQKGLPEMEFVPWQIGTFV